MARHGETPGEKLQRFYYGPPEGGHYDVSPNNGSVRL
jgi:hypothetical protein